MIKTPLKTKFKYNFLRINFKHPKKTKSKARIKIFAKKNLIVNPHQLEAVRRALQKPVKNVSGKLSLKLMPTLPKSKKPLNSRMGKGKGRNAEVGYDQKQKINVDRNVWPNNSQFKKSGVIFAMKKIRFKLAPVKIEFSKQKNFIISKKQKLKLKIK